ncbi:MAG: sulfurtransferase [Janthinobacterium lividum]
MSKPAVTSSFFPHLKSPIISAEALSALLLDTMTDVVVFDCSFDLADAALGERNYASGHLTGAIYLHLDTVLSTTKTGSNGRHPLPTRETFAAAMAAFGVNDDTLIVAYDASGSMYASRLWWMARWAGHENVCVLDGGQQAWTAAGHELSADKPVVLAAGNFTLRPALARTVSYAEVLANIHSAQRQVVDARSPDRFRGENETIDPIGGHIPKAINRFFKDNLTASGHFKPAAQLHNEFLDLIGDAVPDEIISQCGSGVTACHNLLAMEIAGLEGAALYPGSWSEWCAQPDAPVATGS